MLELAKSDHQRALQGIEALQTQMTFRFSVLAKLLDQQMAGIAAANGLSLGAYRALATIEAFGQITAADLTRMTAYDKAAVSRQVAELASQGLVTVTQDPDHGRRKILALTDAGCARMDGARPAVEARRAGLSEALEPAEEQHFLNAIEKLATHVAGAMNAAA